MMHGLAKVKLINIDSVIVKKCKKKLLVKSVDIELMHVMENETI
jgi:hypothetical protein